MQNPSFESLLSAPWAEPEKNDTSGPAYHLTPHQTEPEYQGKDDDSVEHTVILGYN